MFYIREINPTPILFRDYTLNGNTYTTMSCKYLYGNPYLARLGNESDIIAWYVGDPYFSNNYGIYQYEKEEINSFISIYKETRDYYYKVLLNESFINEENYSLYEKSFLLIWTIERVLTNKIKTLKDIDSFNNTDIKNFLYSFGLENLAEILDKNVYTNSEIEFFGKNIIRNFIDLSQYKGSREVINILQKIFSVNNNELKIKKVKLINSRYPNGDSFKNIYRFVMIDYDSEDELTAIKQNYNSAISMKAYTVDDPYWYVGNKTTENILDNYNLTEATSKYLIPKLSVDVYADYIRNKITFAVLNKAIEIIEEDENDNSDIRINSNVISADNDLTLKDLLDELKTLIVEYYQIKDNKISSQINNITGAFFNINSSILTELDSIFDSESNFDIKSDYLNRFKLNKLNDDSSTFENLLRLLSIFVKYFKHSDENPINSTDILKSLIDNGIMYYTSVYNQYIDIKTDDDVRTISGLSYEELEALHHWAELFISKGINSDMKPSDGYNSKIPNEKKQTIDDLMSLISGILNDLNNISQLNLHLTENSISTLKFLTAAINEFISYTSTLKDPEYIKSINASTEALFPGDKIEMTMINYEMDSFYYDEEVILEEVNKEVSINSEESEEQ